jgi:hypothetical protein
MLRHFRGDFRFRFCTDLGGDADATRFCTLSKASSLSSVPNSGGLDELAVLVRLTALGRYRGPSGSSTGHNYR